jgi:hypothetical protein
MTKRWVAVLAVALGVASARPAAAVDVGEGKLSVNGFGQWGYGRTAGENGYYIGTEQGEYDNAQFSLAVTARPAAEVVVAGQLFFQSEGEIALDWGFAEYRVSDLLRVRAGKVKNPLGLFMEVKDVGTLRPFFSLPQSIYGPGNIGSESYLGAGVTGEWTAASGWGVAYDAYGGALEMPAWEPSDAVTGAPPHDFSSLEPESEMVRDVIGGRVSLLTPVDGLLFRVSAYTGNLQEDDEDEAVRMTTVGLSAEYALDSVQVRGEVFRAVEGDLETNVAGYAEVAWRFLPKLQAAVRYERARMTKEGLAAASPLRDHEELALGLAFWPRPNIAFKASYHFVDGNRLALPEGTDDGSLDGRTDLLVVGAQFSF